MSDGGARGADEERPEPAWPGAAHPPLGDDLVADPEGARGDDRLGRAERRRPAERDGAGGTVRGQPGPGPRGLPRSGAVGTDTVRRQSRRLRPPNEREGRSEERRVGKEFVSPWRSRWSPDPVKHKNELRYKHTTP